MKRKWYEQLSAVLGVPLMAFFLLFHISRGGLDYKLLPISSLIILFAYIALLQLKKPDAIIKDAELHLFGIYSAKPLIISISEINSIERHLETPIWRVAPLRFSLKDGRTVTFSTGGNESRMKRIIEFIETETTLRIKTT